MGPVQWLKKRWRKCEPRKIRLTESNKKQDSLTLILPGLYMRMVRPANFEIPHEVSMFVPRAEFRKSFEEEGKKTTLEVILNSITLVHAPRHEPLGESPPKGSQAKT